MMKTALKILLPVLVIALAVVVARKMVLSRPKAKRAHPHATALLVDVAPLRATTHAVVVEATGVVVPERTVALQPEISGVIRSEAAGFEVGRRFRKGERIVRLDDRDLRLLVQQRAAALKAAKLERSLERGRAAIAAQEWKLLGGRVKTTAAGRALALRKPHAEAVRARIAQAQTALDQARLNLSRVNVLAPFDCIVRDKRATVGQGVSPASPIATLVGTARFFVQVSVPAARLPYIAVPGLNAKAGEGATVRISQGGGDRGSAQTARARTGQVIRLLPDLDPSGRMARLVVAVDQPLDAPREAAVQFDKPTGDVTAKPATQPSPWLPLLIGSYVRAEITGRSLPKVVAVPRRALHEDDRVHLSVDSKLVIRRVHIAWRERDTVWVDSGLADGDELVLTPIPSPRPGMALRQKKPSHTQPNRKKTGEKERGQKRPSTSSHRAAEAQR